jgi:hypothetical protein
MRISSRLIPTAVILGLVAVGGCGGTESDDAGDTADRVEDSPPSVDHADEPTRADRARGDRDKSERTSKPKPSRSEPKTRKSPEATEPEPAEQTLDAADLDAALLTLDDMPRRWSTLSPNEDDDAGNVCGDDLADAAANLPRAEATYALDPDHGPQVAESVGLVGDRGPELMSLVEQTITECDGKEIGGLPISTSEVRFPDLGDESHTYRIRLEYSKTGQTFDFGFTYVLADDAMLMLFAYDFTTGGPFELLREYAPIAVDKAERVLG